MRRIPARLGRRMNERNVTNKNHPRLRSLHAMKVSLAIAGLLLCVTGCPSGPVGEATGEQANSPAGNAPPALVRVQTIRREEVAPRLLAVGTVRPRHFSTIASAAEGVVDEFPVEQGSFVTAGTVLSRLRMLSTDLALDQQRAVLSERAAEYEQILEPRQEDVDEARGQQLAARAAFENADRRLKELQSLQGRGAATSSSVEEAELLVEETRQRLVAAEAVYRRTSAGERPEEKARARSRLEAQQKQVAFLESEKEKRITRAPFDGFIVSEETYLGQWLSRGDPVVRMARLDEVDVEVPVDQAFVSQVPRGAALKIRVVGTPNPDSESGLWEGTVQSVIPRSDWESGSRSFPVIVRIANKLTGPADAPRPMLREGMMAEVEFFGTPVEATLVPKDSLVRTSRGIFVFAVNPVAEDQPPSVRQVMVETGISQDGWIQVIADDLNPGTAVVTEGAERLRPFQAIQILPDSGDTPPLTP